jgi:hypothetical protein
MRSHTYCQQKESGISSGKHTHIMLVFWPSVMEDASDILCVQQLVVHRTSPYSRV